LHALHCMISLIYILQLPVKKLTGFEYDARKICIEKVNYAVSNVYAHSDSLYPK